MTTNTAYKPSEGKREEFRKYLEKNGIMDALTKVLVNLYEEVDKPDDALMYIIDKLTLQAGLETNKQLTSRIEEMNGRITELQEQLEQMKAAQMGAEAPAEGFEGEGAVQGEGGDPDAPPADAPPEDAPPPEVVEEPPPAE